MANSVPYLGPFEHRPLLPMETAMVSLDLDEDAILGLIEQGKLLWAFNVASPGARKRQPRIWARSLVHYVLRFPQPAAPEYSEASVIRSLLPHEKLVLTCPELRRLFCVSQGHIANLIRLRALEGLNDPHQGPSGVARVSRASVVDFLSKRRMT